MSCSKYIGGFYATIFFLAFVFNPMFVKHLNFVEKHFFGFASQVAALLEVLPNRLTADVLEQLRLSKQALV